MESKNIYQRMSDISTEITRVAKNLSVGIGKAQYKAVGEADVLSAVKPIEKEHGVYSYPVSRKVIDTNVLTSTSEHDGKVVEKSQLFMRIETTYRFVNIDTPSEYIDIITYGDGVDSQDKACGKAMTYADKYALLKAYKIETGDDPDQKASEPLKAVKRPAKQQDLLTTALNYTTKKGNKLGDLDDEELENLSLWAEDHGNQMIVKYCEVIMEDRRKAPFEV